VCYLQDLFVSEQCRGEGFGAALLLAVAAAAKDASAAKLYWLTQADNLRARELYDRVGRQTGFVKYEVSLSPAQMRGSAKSAVVK
jgi:ribosomal protein S18 acetylase RimI-like enzyme